MDTRQPDPDMILCTFEMCHGALIIWRGANLALTANAGAHAAALITGADEISAALDYSNMTDSERADLRRGYTVIAHFYDLALTALEPAPTCAATSPI